MRGNLGKRVLNESYCFANYMIEQQLSSESRDKMFHDMRVYSSHLYYILRNSEREDILII